LRVHSWPLRHSFLGVKPNFVDSKSSVDTYPQAVWEDVGRFIKQLDEDEDDLPGSSYDAARIFQNRVPSLWDMTLGRVSHIVQLAVQRRLLGRQHGRLVPFTRSTVWDKEQYARMASSTSQDMNERNAQPIATWADVRRGLAALFTNQPQTYGLKGIALASLKHLFLAYFGVVLSETALGHAKLSTLLSDPRLAGLFVVVNDGAAAAKLMPLIATSGDLTAVPALWQTQIEMHTPTQPPRQGLILTAMDSQSKWEHRSIEEFESSQPDHPPSASQVPPDGGAYLHIQKTSVSTAGNGSAGAGGHRILTDEKHAAVTEERHGAVTEERHGAVTDEGGRKNVEMAVKNTFIEIVTNDWVVSGPKSNSRVRSRSL